MSTKNEEFFLTSFWNWIGLLTVESDIFAYFSEALLEDVPERIGEIQQTPDDEKWVVWVHQLTVREMLQCHHPVSSQRREASLTSIITFRSFLIISCHSFDKEKILNHRYSMKRIKGKIVAGVSETTPKSEKIVCIHNAIERWIRSGMIWQRTIFCCGKPSWLFSWPWFSGCSSKPAEYLRSELLYVDFVTRFDLRAFQSFTCVLCFHENPEEYWATFSIISWSAVVLICHDLQDLDTCGPAVLDLPFHSYFEVHWQKPLLFQLLWSLKEAEVLL